MRHLSLTETYDRRVRYLIMYVLAVCSATVGWFAYSGTAGEAFHLPAFEGVFPMRAWSVAWWASAVALATVGRTIAPARWAMSYTASLYTAWCVGFVIGTAGNGFSEESMFAALFGTVAVSVWIFQFLMEPPRRERLRRRGRPVTRYPAPPGEPL